MQDADFPTGRDAAPGIDPTVALLAVTAAVATVAVAALILRSRRDEAPRAPFPAPAVHRRP